MSLILAIDPGSVESGWCIIDGLEPVAFGKTQNGDLLTMLAGCGDYARMLRDCDMHVIEMVASYGMPVGADVFETCVWIGRFERQIKIHCSALGAPVDLVYRKDVKLHHCHSPRANDATIRQALVDRFAKGQPNYGKGTKAQPGWFYGFRADVWQAYALAVYAADQLIDRERRAAEPAQF